MFLVLLLFADKFVKKTPRPPSLMPGVRPVGVVTKGASQSDSLVVSDREESTSQPGTTQDSIFYDSAFVPTTPPSKKVYIYIMLISCV